jgi:DNA mismatch repair protein MutH
MFFSDSLKYVLTWKVYWIEHKSEKNLWIQVKLVIHIPLVKIEVIWRPIEKAYI